MTQQSLDNLKHANAFLTQRQAHYHLNEATLLSNTPNEYEMIRLSLINLALTTELKELRKRLIESEDARHCALLTIAYLQNNNPMESNQKPEIKAEGKTYRLSA